MSSFLKKVQKTATSGATKMVETVQPHLSKAKTMAEEQYANAVKVDYAKYLEQPVILEGKIWKRRGGIRKYKDQVVKGNTAKVWELRRFELRGSTLLYYSLPSNLEEEVVFGGDSEQLAVEEEATTTDETPTLAASTWTDDSESQSSTTKPVDTTTPRGHLDIKEQKALVHASSRGHLAGAPSPFCLSLVLTTGMTTTHHHETTKWMLAFDDQAVMMEWLTALTNMAVQCSVEGYNTQLIKATTTTAESLRRPPLPLEVEKDKANDNQDPKADNNEKAIAQPANHQALWIAHSNYYILRREDGNKSSESGEPSSSHTAALQAIEKQHQQELQQLKDELEKSITRNRQLQAQVDELTKANANEG